MKKIPYLLILALFAPLLAAATVMAQSASSNLNLLVTVPQEFSYRVVFSPSTFTLSEADVTSGVKTDADPTAVEVDTNMTNGYVLAVQAFGSSGYSSITFRVQGNPASYRLFPGGFAEVHIPFKGVNPATDTLDFTVYVPPGTSPGTYPWPVVVSAHPL